MRFKKTIPLFLITLLTSCSRQVDNGLRRNIYCFSTFVYYELYEGNNTNLNEIQEIFEKVDALSDNYLARPVNNVYTINNTNEEVTIDETLYDLLSKSKEATNEGANYFNLLSGSLSKKWKESVEKNEVLSSSIIEQELEKISTSSLTLKDNNIVQRSGDAEIDLGGIAKGYALDLVNQYLKSKNIGKFYINAGKSSVLLGEYNSTDGYFNVHLEDCPGFAFRCKNSFVSTSATSVQGKVIDGVMYSHIINPNTGSAINNYDAVIVVSNSGYLGDALSTSMMMNTLEEIKEIEAAQNVKCVVVKEGSVIYYNPTLEVI